MEKFYYLIFTILLLLVIFVIKYFNNISEFFFGGQDSKNPKGELLKIIVQVLGGIILLSGAYYSLKIADSMHKNNMLIEKGNIADRFRNAIHMLENKNSITCLSGIYALNNIAKENDEYREQIFNILVEFINNKTKLLPSWAEMPNSKRIVAQPSIEIKTIFKILFSKEDTLYRNYSAHFKNAKLYGGIYDDYNLSCCKFKNVEFQNSSFKRTLFVKSEIFNSDFSFSVFPNTNLTGSVIMDSSKFACCRFSWTRFTKSFIQGTDFSCSSMFNVLFEGALVNVCNFNGVELINLHGMNEGNFSGSSFSSISIKGLVCSGGIIARGASFESGVPFPPNFKLKNSIGEKAKININSKLEEFPKSEINYFKKLMGNPINVKSYGGTLLNLEHNILKTTGWIFADTGKFTSDDYKIIQRKYKEDIKKANNCRVN